MVGEPRAFQGTSPYGNALLNSACEAIKSAPDGKQEETLNDRSFQIGRFVGGGLLSRDETITDLIKAGLQMVDYDPDWEWTEDTIREYVEYAVDDGMLKPLDGEESFRAMQAVHERYLNNPLLYDDVIELLLDEEAKREAEQPQEKKQEPPPKNAAPESPLVRRMGKGIPVPVAFLVEELFHEVGTGIIASKFYGGKTYVAMSIAASVTSGISFASRTILRKGAVLWLAAEGEWEVDKRIRAAVRALGCDPEVQPIYVQIASVPQLLQGGEAAVMKIVRQAEQMARDEFGLPLVLIVIDTMIKAAGYKKSENDSVEVNNMIRCMENISVRAKCFVLALDHMGKNEELGARGSSDKPSSVDVYIKLKSNGGSMRTFHVVKVKGEKGNDQLEFEIVGAKLEDGQKTACVRWGKWREPDLGGKPLNGNARVLLDCVRDTIIRRGQERIIYFGMPEKRAVQKKEIYAAFSKKHKSGRPDMAFKRSWDELVKAEFVTTVGDEDSAADLDKWVYLEKE